MKPLTLAAALLALPLCALAAEPAAQEPAAETASEASAGNTSNCLQATGSRITTSAERPCVAAPGQVITREQLDRSGATTTAEALRKASPAIR